jgi:hypothetical protein
MLIQSIISEENRVCFCRREASFLPCFQLGTRRIFEAADTVWIETGRRIQRIAD